MATGGYLDLASSGYFFMATDNCYEPVTSSSPTATGPRSSPWREADNHRIVQRRRTPASSRGGGEACGGRGRPRRRRV